MTKKSAMKLFSILVFSFSFIVCQGQDYLRPGKESFEKKWIKNHSYQMTWYALRDSSKFEMGKVKTDIIADKEKLTIVTEVSLKNMKSPWIDSSIADFNTLAPIRHSSYNMQRDMILNFGNLATGYYEDKMKKSRTIISDTLSQGYFDSNLYPYLIGWLPLKNGYQQDISIYDYNPSGKKGLLKASVKGVSEGMYFSDKSGEREVWIVSVSDEISNGSSRYHFDKKDRRLWMQEIDANGRKMLMKLIE